jgi:hypothetical protein
MYVVQVAESAAHLEVHLNAEIAQHIGERGWTRN